METNKWIKREDNEYELGGWAYYVQPTATPEVVLEFRMTKPLDDTQMEQFVEFTEDIAKQFDEDFKTIMGENSSNETSLKLSEADAFTASINFGFYMIDARINVPPFEGCTSKGVLFFKTGFENQKYIFTAGPLAFSNDEQSIEAGYDDYEDYLQNYQDGHYEYYSYQEPMVQFTFDEE